MNVLENYIKCNFREFDYIISVHKTLATRDTYDLANTAHVLMVWLTKTCRFKMKKTVNQKCLLILVH